MQSLFPEISGFRPAYVAQAAGCQQPSPKGPEPVEPPVRKRLWPGDASMTQPGQPMLIEKRISDVHGAVDDQFIPQARSGIDPGDARPPFGSILSPSRFDPATLPREIGTESCRESVCKSVEIRDGAV